jgi:hypothetical protein
VRRQVQTSDEIVADRTRSLTVPEALPELHRGALPADADPVTKALVTGAAAGSVAAVGVQMRRPGVETPRIG